MTSHLTSSHPIASRPDATRASYDTVAVDYNELRKAELENKPFDRAMLAAFAEKVRAGGGGRVADLGCGPGRVTIHVAGDTGPLKDWAPTWLHNQVRPRIKTVLTRIHDVAPNAKIILMGYPELLSGAKDCVVGVGKDNEAPWLNSVADMLDQEMDGAASDAKSQDGINVVFADPRNKFLNKAVCGNPENVNGIVENGRSQADTESPNSAMASFHPKIAGARLYADVLQQYLP